MLLWRQGRCSGIKDTEVNKGHKGKATKGHSSGFRSVSFVSFVSSVSRGVARIGEMHLPVRVVTRGKILSVVTAAALFAPQRRTRDQSCDGEEIVTAPCVRGGWTSRRLSALKSLDR